MTAVDLGPAVPVAPAPPPFALLCTLCVVEAKQAELRKTDVPEVHPAIVIANGMGLCEQRHTLNVGPQLLIAQPGQAVT